MTLLEYQNKMVGESKDFFRKTNIGWLEIEGLLKEIGKIEYSPYTLCDKIYATKSYDELLDFYKNCTDAYVKALEQKGKKAEEEEEESNRKKKLDEDLKKVEENSRKDKERINEDLNKYKRNDNPNLPPLPNDKPKFKDNDFDEQKKQEYISDVEFYLKEKSVSDEKLNQRLKVSNWKEEINKTTNWSQSLDRKYDVRKIIDELSREYECANCRTVKNNYFPYESKGKKYCSYECEKEGQGGKIEVSDIEKIVKAFQKWMKKNSIEKISYSAKGELIIQFKGQTAKAVEDSQLSAEQKEVKKFFQKNPQASEIAVNKEFQHNPTDPGKKGGKFLSNMTKGEVALIGLVIVGIFALIITLIVRATRRKD